MTHEDLISEAVTALLEERRIWRPDKVDLLGHLLGAIRSISSNRRTRRESRSGGAAHVSDDVMATFPARGVSPEIDAMRAERTAAILEAFASDTVASSILMGLFEGVSFASIREAHGIGEKPFAAAIRRIRRHLATAASSGSEGGKPVCGQDARAPRVRSAPASTIRPRTTPGSGC